MFQNTCLVLLPQRNVDWLCKTPQEKWYFHTGDCVWGGRGTMRHGTNSKGALIPPYRQNSGAHIVNAGTDRQSSWGIPRQFLPALGWISLLHLCHRTSCREELAKPLLFFQGSLKDISHKNLFLLLNASLPPSIPVLRWLSWQMATLRYHPSQWRRPIRKVRSYESTTTLYLSLKNSQPGGDKEENNSTSFLWVLRCPAFIKIPPGAEDTKRRNYSGHIQQRKANAKAVGSRPTSVDTTQWFASDDHSIYVNWLFVIMKPYMDWLKGTRRNPCMTCLLPQHH